MKTFGSKPLQREPKRGSDNFVRAQVLGVSSACRASIENVFESFKFPNRVAGDLTNEAQCANAPVLHLLNLERFRFIGFSLQRA